MKGGAFLALLLAVACGHADPPHTPLDGEVKPAWGGAQPGESSPPFTLPSVEGGEVSLASLRGSWVLLHFTETWRPTSDTEAAALGDIADRFRARGLKVVVIDVKEPFALWRAYAKSRLLPSVVALHDELGSVAAGYAPPGVMTSMTDRSEVMLSGSAIVDPDGKLSVLVVPDPASFDPTLRDLALALDEMLPGRRQVSASEGPASPLPSSSDADAVHVTQMATVPVARGGHGVLEIALDIANGYHVMSDHPPRSSYVATRVSVEPVSPKGLRFGAPAYPAPLAISLGGEPITIFDGHVSVLVPFEVSQEAAVGSHPLVLSVRYQACSGDHCLAPRTDVVHASVEVR